MSQPQNVSFFTEKAPNGGYKLGRISKDDDGKFIVETITYRTRLVEIQQIEHQLKEQLFGEAAWYPLSPPLMPASHVIASASPASSPEHDDGSMPKFAQDYAENGGMMGELYRRGNGAVRALIPMLFIASLWLVNLPGVRM